MGTATATRHRLVTRSDFDGLVCAALLKQLGMLDDVLFVHPKDMQDGKINVRPTDITTNLPYVPGVHLAFDHHASETIRVGTGSGNHVIDPGADSAARVVYRYFGGEDAFPWVADELLEAVDKADSARFTAQDVLDPEGWVLLSFLMDPRTGLGRFRDFRISNYQLMMQLIPLCTHLPVEQILAQPDVAERVDLYRAHAGAAISQLKRRSTEIGEVVVVDLRNDDLIHPTNRFTVYALFGEQNVSVHVLKGLRGMNTVLAVGKSVLNRTNGVDVGALMLEYGGGGHEAAGTCQVDNDDADRVLGEIVARLNEV